MSASDVGPDNKLSNQKLFTDFMIDGEVRSGRHALRCRGEFVVFELRRSRRRLQWVTVWTPEGKLIGRIRLLGVTANVCFEYLQSWDVPNLFVVGASAFPQISSLNPTGTVSAALAYLTADAIKSKYLKNPRPLI
jgi:hypothetical protein